MKIMFNSATGTWMHLVHLVNLSLSTDCFRKIIGIAIFESALGKPCSLLSHTLSVSWDFYCKKHLHVLLNHILISLNSNCSWFSFWYREQPLDAVQQDTSASRQRTACQAISSLLSSSSQDSQSLSVPLPRHPIAPDTPSLSEQHLAKMIPVIQEQLDCYLQELEALMERIRNRSRSESTSHHEVDERFLEEQVVECRAKALVPGLQTLSKLCCYSRSICKMITAGCDEIHDAMDTCVEEIDPSAPITVS